MDFVPKFIFSLSIFFALVISGVVLPFLILVFYCWLRIRGKKGKRIRESSTGDHHDIPLRQLLGPLPLFLSSDFVYSFKFCSVILECFIDIQYFPDPL